jgi:hypothetical protein
LKYVNGMTMEMHRMGIGITLIGKRAPVLRRSAVLSSDQVSDLWRPFADGLRLS